MILCDCCERRDGDSLDPYHCYPCFCQEWLPALSALLVPAFQPLHIVDEEFEDADMLL
jgi:hypothetical protein